MQTLRDKCFEVIAKDRKIISSLSEDLNDLFYTFCLTNPIKPTLGDIMSKCLNEIVILYYQSDGIVNIRRKFDRNKTIICEDFPWIEILLSVNISNMISDEIYFNFDGHNVVGIVPNTHFDMEHEQFNDFCKELYFIIYDKRGNINYIERIFESLLPKYAGLTIN